ncbi:MAG: FG-GAP repeat protein, partial [Planctomycetes bacterium]|nr:FG-GAP repeat protein [Planctomycetota bacterium]
LLAAPTVTQRTLMQSFGNGAGAHFGAALARVGDLDGDGRPELVIGSPNFSPNPNAVNMGAATVIDGRTGAFRYQIGPLPSAQAFAGAAVAAGRDINHDGYPDFVVGAPNYNGGFGAVTAHSGATGALLWTRDVTGSNLRQFGTAALVIPDLSNDGRADVVVGAPGNPNGMPSAHRLNSFGAVLATPAVGASGSDCGISVAELSDLTNDGIPEVAIGEPGYVRSGRSGRVRVIDLATARIVHELVSFPFDSAAGQFVANAGDVDADGADDILVSYRDTWSAGQLTPRVTVFSGRTGSQLGTATFGATIEASFGKATAGIGDFDGDGGDDFAVGVPDYNGGAGRVVVYSGRTQVAIATIDGDAGSHFGASIAWYGDFDGDGRDDFAVGAPDHVQNGAPVGRVSVHGLRITGIIGFFGTSCSGQSNAPSLYTLALLNTLRPGGSFRIYARNVVPASTTYWLWGFSDTVTNGVPLPFDLTPLGFPNCNLLVSPDVVIAFASSSIASVTLPNDPRIAGGRVYLQAAVAGAAYANGISFSNGASILIGN